MTADARAEGLDELVVELPEGGDLVARPVPALGTGIFMAFDKQSQQRRFFEVSAGGDGAADVRETTSEVVAELARAVRERLRGRRRGGAKERNRQRRLLAAADDKQPLDYQQAHSPTEAVEIIVKRSVVPDGRGGVARVVVTAQQGVRRIVDARLWDRMSPAEQRAAERIYAAFAILSRGLGAHMSALGREIVDGGRGDCDYQQDVVDDYFRWRERCRREGVDHAAIMDVLGYGHSCAETDRRRRRRKGYTSAALSEGLDLYCAVKGWPRWLKK